jgi:hypothetical protein
MCRIAGICFRTFLSANKRGVDSLGLHPWRFVTTPIKNISILTFATQDICVTEPSQIVVEHPCPVVTPVF